MFMTHGIVSLYGQLGILVECKDVFGKPPACKLVWISDFTVIKCVHIMDDAKV